MSTVPSLPHRARFAIALCAGAGLLAAVPASAPALVVSSDENGLQMREPDNILDRVKLSLVDAGDGVLKYRVEMAQFGGRGIGFGRGCTQASTTHGLDIAHCDRLNPVVSQVSFGPMRDTLEVDPAFPDPITVRDGGIGPDIFTLGAGNDVSTADREDAIFGRLGDDELTSTGGRVDGGEGNDRLHARSGTGVLVGGVGDDVLSAEGAATAQLIGGEGTDTFDGGGALGRIDSRDGLVETVVCGDRPLGRRMTAVVDLVDLPSDADLLAGGCASVDRAPRGEQMAARLKSPSPLAKRGRVRVRVRCASSSRCIGTLTLTAKGRARTADFSVPAKKTRTVRVAGRAGRAVVLLSEQGIKGLRTIQRGVTVR